MIILHSVDITERIRTSLRVFYVIDTIPISASPDPNYPFRKAILYESVIQSIRFVIATEFTLVSDFNTKTPVKKFNLINNIWRTEGELYGKYIKLFT